MPPRPNRGKRRERRINVFVQEEAPRGRSVIEDDDASAVAVDEPVENGTAGSAAIATARSRRLRTQRASRQARARSDVFTRTLSAEMRKLGILSTAILAILIALTFVL